MIHREGSFLKLPYSLLWCDGYIDENEVKVKMNMSDKIVYSYIKSRYQFFKSLGKEYFDSQQSIAEVCNLDVRSVNTIMRSFEKGGVLVVLKRPFGQILKNVYTFIRDLEVYRRKFGEKKNSTRKSADVDLLLISENEFVYTMPDVNYTGVLDPDLYEPVFSDTDTQY